MKVSVIDGGLLSVATWWRIIDEDLLVAIQRLWIPESIGNFNGKINFLMVIKRIAIWPNRIMVTDVALFSGGQRSMFMRMLN